jgi:hypothetical protein
MEPVMPVIVPEVIDLTLDETIIPQTEPIEIDNYIPVTPLYFQELLNTGTESHITWLLIKTLMNNIVKRFDAVIFGGAVRDLLRHDYASNAFYQLSTYDKYDDETIHPELSDRFLLPSDIDFFIKHSDYFKFKTYLFNRGFYYKGEKKMDLTYINDKLAFGQYTLIKAEIIYFDKKNKKMYPIKLDMILCNKVVIPPMDSDFNVNKLLMTNQGIVVFDCVWKYNEIKEYINKKEALCNSTISERRYEKLSRKGWKIIMNYSTFVFKLRKNLEEENCIICLDQLKVGELEVTPRHCKCIYSYCKNCIHYSLKTDDCLMCKKAMCLVEKKCDIMMYEKHQLLE